MLQPKNMRRTLSRANNELSFDDGGALTKQKMQVTQRQTYARGGQFRDYLLGLGGTIARSDRTFHPGAITPPTSNPQTYGPRSSENKPVASRRTYQASFQRREDGGTIKKKGCSGGILRRCRGGRVKLRKKA